MAQNLSQPLSSKNSKSSASPKNKYFVIGLGAAISILAISCLISLLKSPTLTVDGIASFYHEYPAYIFSISQDNTILVTATESGTIHAWNIQAKSRVSKFVYPGKVTGIDITYDNQYIVASGDDKAVRVFSLKTNSQVSEFLHSDQVTQFKILLGEYRVFTICGDNQLRIWKIGDSNASNYIETSGGVITAFDISAFDYRVIIGCKSGRLEVWSILLYNSKSYSIDLQKSIAQVNYSFIFDHISVQFDNNSFTVLRIGKRNLKISAELDYEINNSIVKLGKESQYAVVAGEKIEVLDLYNEKKIDEFKHGDRVNSVAITTNGYHVISASDDNVIRVWEIGSGKEATSNRTPGKVKNIELSHDQRYFAAGGDDGYVRVYTLYI